MLHSESSDHDVSSKADWLKCSLFDRAYLIKLWASTFENLNVSSGFVASSDSNQPVHIGQRNICV